MLVDLYDHIFIFREDNISEIKKNEEDLSANTS